MEYYEICTQIGARVSEVAKNLFCTAEAGEELGEGAGGDVTTYIDKECEKAAFSIMRAHAEMRKERWIVYSEEQGEIIFGEPQAKEVFVFMDPLDGSFNAKSRLPFFSIAIAFSTSPLLRDVKAGYVENLLDNTKFYAQIGKGAYRNGKPMQTSRKQNICSSAFTFTQKKEKMDNYTSIMRESQHIREFGSAALNMCYFAQGSFEIFYSAKARALDLSAPLVIAKEAGGLVTNEEGEDLFAGAGNFPIKGGKTSVICSANESIQNQVLKIFEDGVEKVEF